MTDSAPEEILNSWLSADYERRHYRRWKMNERGAVKHFGTQEPCLVRDISPGGACIEFDGSEKLAVNEKITLLLEGLPAVVAEVQSVLDGQIGLSFLHGVQGEQAFARWLTQEENTRRQHRRKTVACPVTLTVCGRAYLCITQNVTIGGARIEGEEIASLRLNADQFGTEIALEIDVMEPIRGNILYKIQHTMGIKFNHNADSLKALTDWIYDIRHWHAHPPGRGQA